MIPNKAWPYVKALYQNLCRCLNMPAYSSKLYLMMIMMMTMATTLTTMIMMMMMMLMMMMMMMIMMLMVIMMMIMVIAIINIYKMMMVIVILFRFYFQIDTCIYVNSNVLLYTIWLSSNWT